MPQYRLGRQYARALEEAAQAGGFIGSEDVLRYLIKTHAPDLIQANQAVIIDPHAADNRALRTQDQWIAYFNDAGKAMISAPNVYKAGKHASDNVLASLQRDFNELWLVSSTRIGYGADLSGKITHNHGSRVVTPSSRDVRVIPVYDWAPLSQVLQTDEGIDYLHSLTDTEDEPKDITGTLENLSKRSADRIGLWTPSQGSRDSYSERAVRFYDGDGRFHVNGYLLDGYGRSRGVSMKSPRSRRAKK